MAAQLSRFRVELTRSGAMVIISLHGELDLAARPQCDDAIADALTSHPLIVAIDLRGLQFLDANGIGAVVQTAERCARTGRRFLIIRGGDEVHAALAAAGVEGLFEIVDQPDEDSSRDALGDAAVAPTAPARRPRARSG